MLSFLGSEQLGFFLELLYSVQVSDEVFFLVKIFSKYKIEQGIKYKKNHQEISEKHTQTVWNMNDYRFWVCEIFYAWTRWNCCINHCVERCHGTCIFCVTVWLFSVDSWGKKPSWESRFNPLIT